MPENNYEPKIIGFLCNWCSYAGADLAGGSRLKYPPNLKIIRVPCSGRVSPELIIRTFQEGADGVMMLGCHIGDCHYSTGNHRTARRMPVLKALLEFTGIESERFLAKWVSASEGNLFVETVKEFTETLRQMDPLELQKPIAEGPVLSAAEGPVLSAAEGRSETVSS